MPTIYATCPASADEDPSRYLQRVRDVSVWTERANLQGLLVYNDNSLHDPWLVAQYIIGATEKIVPMVALQPVHASPFSAARAINTIGHMCNRRVDVNLVTGGFAGHLRALGCDLTHDERYDRLVEFGEILNSLLKDEKPVSYSGTYYTMRAARLSPPIRPHMAPKVYVSGSSEASHRAQVMLKATRLSYPLWIDDYPDRSVLAGTGMRIGIIARECSNEAWRVARERFPRDTQGERLHDYAGRSVQSDWHKKLSAAAHTSFEPSPGFWLYPFRAYKTFCPYLVGSYREVASLLEHYFKSGVDVLILDVPESEADLAHATAAINAAS